MNSSKIVVCGATGNQGGAVAAALLKGGGWSVTALTRDPGSAAAQALADLGAEVTVADLLDMGSLLHAFDGAHGVFGLTQPWSYATGRFDTFAEIRQGRNIIWACREAGVPNVVFSTVINLAGKPSGVPWIDSKLFLEEIIKSNLPQAVIVRPALYMENIGSRLLRFRGNSIIGRFGDDAPVPYVALSDIGSSVAEIFSAPGRFAGDRITLAGDIVSGREIASFLSGSTGERNMQYDPVSELRLRLFSPAFFFMRRFFEEQGRLLHAADTPGIAHARLPHDPLGMEDFLNIYAGKLIAAAS